MNPSPQQWSKEGLCHRAGFAGAFLTTPIYPAPGVRGDPRLARTSWDVAGHMFAATASRVSLSTWGLRAKESSSLQGKAGSMSQ